MGYLNHYQDNQLRNAQFNILSQNITNIQTTINNIGGSGNCATANQANAISSQINQQAILIGGVANQVSNLPTYNAQLSQLQNTANATANAVNAIPNYSTSIGNVQSSLTSQAIVIGGIANNQANQATSSQVSNLQATTSNIPRYNAQSDIANLSSQVGNIPITNYSSNFSAVGNQLTALQSTANATQSRVNGIPNGSYNGQLDRMETTLNASRTEGQNIPRFNASSDLAAIRANQANQATASALGNVATQVTAIQTTVNANLGQSAYVSVDSTIATALYSANNPGLDLIWLLGNSETAGFINPSGVKFTATPSSSADATNYPISGIFNRNSSSSIGWYSTNTANSNVVFDFQSTRTITLKAIRMGAWQVGYPNNGVIIEGSSNGSSWSAIATWANPGFNSNYSFRLFSFSNTTAYRYIRLKQSGLNTLGDNTFGIWGLWLYGTLTNP